MERKLSGAHAPSSPHKTWLSPLARWQSERPMHGQPMAAPCTYLEIPSTRKDNRYATERQTQVVHPRVRKKSNGGFTSLGKRKLTYIASNLNLTVKVCCLCKFQRVSILPTLATDASRCPTLVWDGSESCIFLPTISLSKIIRFLLSLLIIAVTASQIWSSGRQFTF